MCVYIYINIHINIHIYIYMYTYVIHTYIYLYILSFAFDSEESFWSRWNALCGCVIDILRPCFYACLHANSNHVSSGFATRLRDMDQPYVEVSCKHAWIYDVVIASLAHTHICISTCTATYIHMHTYT